MIYAMVLFACIDGFVDFSGTIPDAALPMPVDTEHGEAAKLPDPLSELADPSVGKLCGTEASPFHTRTVIAPIVPLVVKEASIEASCKGGFCRARDADEADTRLSDVKDGRDSVPARRFQPLRRLFRR